MKDLAAIGVTPKSIEFVTLDRNFRTGDSKGSRNSVVSCEYTGRLYNMYV